jgi:hypothetical protein
VRFVSQFAVRPRLPDASRRLRTRGRGGKTSAQATTSLWRCGTASGGQRLTFLNRTLFAGVPIPPLEVEIAA